MCVPVVWRNTAAGETTRSISRASTPPPQNVGVECSHAPPPVAARAAKAVIVDSAVAAQLRRRRTSIPTGWAAHCARGLTATGGAEGYPREDWLNWRRTPTMFIMSFGIYLGGIVLVLGGLVYAATLLHVPAPWIVAGALVVMGFGIVIAVKATRTRDG